MIYLTITENKFFNAHTVVIKKECIRYDVVNI
jgi:hypothetical protein